MIDYADPAPRPDTYERFVMRCVAMRYWRMRVPPPWWEGTLSDWHRCVYFNFCDVLEGR